MEDPNTLGMLLEVVFVVLVACFGIAFLMFRGARAAIRWWCK